MAEQGSGAQLSAGASLVLIYNRLRTMGACTVEDLAETGLGLDASQAGLAGLRALGLVSEPADGLVAAVSPEAALARLINQERLRRSEAERNYAAIETLATQFLPTTHHGHADIHVEMLTSRAHISHVLTEMTDLLNRETASMHPGALPSGDFLTQGLESDRRLIEAGARVRVIYQQRFTSVPELAEFFREQVKLGVEVRLATMVPLNMILGDQKFALLPIDPGNQDAGAILVRGAALVRSCVAMYEYCWYTSAPFGADRGAQFESIFTEQQQAIVRMMGAGLKDEKIARNLGVSVRTVSRLVAEIMQVLGTTSRFAAGVRAAKFGWLD